MGAITGASRTSLPQGSPPVQEIGSEASSADVDIPLTAGERFSGSGSVAQSALRDRLLFLVTAFGLWNCDVFVSEGRWQVNSPILPVENRGANGSSPVAAASVWTAIPGLPTIARNTRSGVTPTP